MTVKIKVINNKNQNMKHKDNNLQIPITLLNLVLRTKIKSEMMKSAVYANYSPQKKSERAHV
jgi:hypothetical protein